MITKKIVHVSDTHFAHQYINIPDGDLLIHTGDALRYGSLQELVQFSKWMNSLPHQHKIYIPGNHDKICEQDTNLAKSELGPNIHFLINEGIELFGKKIWGSPITPWFNNWSFMRYRGSDIAEIWQKIPEDTDILLTHGPPKGILDEVFVGRDRNAGCEDLLERIQVVKPELHLFGHIHEGHGQLHTNGTSFYNSAIMDDWYRPVNSAHVIEIVTEE